MFKTILVAVDVDDPASAPAAIAAGEELAHCCGARLILCTVAGTGGAGFEECWTTIAARGAVDQARVRLAALADTVRGVPVTVEVAGGPVASALVETARRTEADLILISAHAPGLADLLFESDDVRVARRAPCSVLVMRADLPAPVAMAQAAAATAV